MDLTPFNKIPATFLRRCLTKHQKEFIQIKYCIKEAMDNRKGTRTKIYKDLEEEMPLSAHTIRKLAQSV